MSKIINDSQDEISLLEIFLSIAIWWKFLKSKWYILAIFSIFGLVFGYISLIRQPDVFKAEVKFVVEGSTVAAADPLKGLTASLGIKPEPSSEIGGDIIYMMSSPHILERALISKVKLNKREDYIANFFIDYRNSGKSIFGTNEIIYPVKFNGIRDSSDLDQNVFFRSIIGDLRKKLEIEGGGIISATYEAEDKYFPKIFLDKLLDVTANYYSLTKTGKILRNVKTLSKQTDSLRALLSGSISSVAYSGDSDPNSVRQNTVKIDYQKKQIDNAVLQTTYQTLASSLVAARIELGKETPFIQVYEKPILPLVQVPKPGKIIQSVKFMLVFLVVGVIILTVIYLSQKMRASLKNS